ncbi:MAG: hypothetical protein CMJ45_07485 [Planctomyces sp.]|nr:hypothetical protein [Planctomyces sp.]
MPDLFGLEMTWNNEKGFQLNVAAVSVDAFARGPRENEKPRHPVDLDLVPLIVQTDSSRVVSVMIQDHFVIPKVAGVSGNHHNLSHHGQDKAKIEQLQKVETEIVKCLGSLLGRMKSKSETGASLLENTSILFGSNLGNANPHHARNLPIFLAGGGFKHGRYVATGRTKNTPLCNLFVTMLNNAGLETESFGQSSGALTW